MSLATLAARLKGEPGIWSIFPVPIEQAPTGDATATHHGAGEHPAIPSYHNRMLVTVAVDVVRLYYLADDLSAAADKQILIDGAEKLYNKTFILASHLAILAEQGLVMEILGHWPLPPPSLWLLRIVNAVCAYNNALRAGATPNDPAVAAARAAVQGAINQVIGQGDGSSPARGGGH